MGKRLDLVGQVFGLLTVRSFAGMTERHESTWNCGCVCGGSKVVKGDHLKRGEVKSCGCLRPLKYKWESNEIIGTVKLIRFLSRRVRRNCKNSIKTYNYKWLCICLICNKKVVLADQAIRARISLKITDCRCDKLGITVGTEEYRMYYTWYGMKNRCNNVKHKHYKDYGGRGIKVCKKWEEDFWAFHKYMGPRPSKDHSIDRIDNDGNYEPGNVKWSTPKEQANNKRNTKKKEQAVCL